jgi:hypothetical protein
MATRSQRRNRYCHLMELMSLIKLPYLMAVNLYFPKISYYFFIIFGFINLLRFTIAQN